MHKRLSLQQLLGIQTSFFQHVQNIMKSERCPMFKQLLKAVTKEGDEIYYIREGSGYFRIIKKDETNYTLIDEVEKIELPIWEAEINQIHNLLKWDKKVQKIMKDNKSIRNTLEEEYLKGQRKTFLEKPYIVYDIETIWTTNDLKSHEFTVGYMFDSTSWAYRYISKEGAKRFADFLLGYEWWIVAFNQLWFDNAVLINNVWYGEKELAILNEKSVDIFYFIWNKLKRKIGLNKLSEALIWIKKTLSDGLEWSKLYKEYIATGDEKLLSTVKSYCKNDVKMTFLVFLYLLKYQKLLLDGTEIIFNDKELQEFGRVLEAEDMTEKNGQQTIFQE